MCVCVIFEIVLKHQSNMHMLWPPLSSKINICVLVSMAGGAIACATDLSHHWEKNAMIMAGVEIYMRLWVLRNPQTWLANFATRTGFPQKV